MTRTAWTALVGFLLIAGSAADAAAQGTTPNACGLVTRDEASAAVGAPVTEGKPNPGGSMAGAGIDVTGCTYTGGSRDLSVSLWRFSPAAKQSLEVYRGLCKKKEQVTGLGDVACWYNANHNELQVLKGPALVIVQLRGRSPDALTTVAKQALTRLK